jgi:DNA integrity scanning protein DisA with diadenylate cyclase activity
MKASNKFRLTKTFCVLNGDAHKIARIVKRYGSQIVSISHEHKPRGSYDDARTYVVRLIEADRALVDVEVYCDTMDRVIERERVVVVPATSREVA